MSDGKKHALLSPSASHRWINCPPSARLTEFYTDTGSGYAQEGTLAHSVGEAKLKHRLGLAKKPSKCNDSEMDEGTDDYVTFVMEQMDGLSDPKVFVEQRVDCSLYIPECSGTCDALIISDGVLQICDLKYGRGVRVAAEGNEQLMTQHGVPSPGGVKQWQSTTIESILTNEKYRGDALLQKTFTVDFLTKKMKKNEGEVQSFYVKGSHPAIVSGEVFELAQSELRRRRESGRRICSGSVFASKLVCGECGGIYGSKVWGSNTKYRKMIWQCNNKYGKKATRCTTPHLTDEQIKAAFVEMLNGLIENRDEIAAFYDDLLDKLTDVTALEEQKNSLEREAASVNRELHDWIMENARRAMSKEVYDARFDELDGKLNTVKGKLEKVSDEILRRSTRRLSAQNVLLTVKEAGPIADFDEDLFGALVDTVIVHPDKMIFALKDGSERTVSR